MRIIVVRGAVKGEYHFVVQTEIAAEVGFDAQKFKEHISSGSAVEAFQKDREECAEYGGKGLLLRGYRRYDQFIDAVGELGIELD